MWYGGKREAGSGKSVLPSGSCNRTHFLLLSQCQMHGAPYIESAKARWLSGKREVTFSVRFMSIKPVDVDFAIAFRETGKLLS